MFRQATVGFMRMDVDAGHLKMTGRSPPSFSRGVGVPNSIYLVFPIKGKMEPQWNSRGHPLDIGSFV